MCAVADKRCSFFDQGGNDDFSELSVRKYFTGYRVDDLNVNIIIPVVHTTVMETADSDSRSIDFRQTIDVIEFNSKFFRDAPAHFFTPAFRTNDSFLQMDLVFDSSFLDFFCKKQGVRGSRTENGCLHIHHHLKLFVCVSGSHRNDHSAQFFSAGLKTDSGSPQSVSGCDLDTVQICKTGQFIAALKHDCPVVYIFLSIWNDDRQSGGTGRRVDSDNLFFRCGHQTKRISIS